MTRYIYGRTTGEGGLASADDNITSIADGGTMTGHQLAAQGARD